MALIPEVHLVKLQAVGSHQADIFVFELHISMMFFLTFNVSFNYIQLCWRH